jgi:hypothetical protein
MGKLTDKQKKEIIASYVECENYSEVARKFNMSDEGVRKIVKQNEDSWKQLEQKREENTQEVLEAMKIRNKTKIELIDKIFKAMDGKLNNVDMFTNIKDLATAYGIIMDKELKIRELNLKEQEIKENKNNNKDTLDKLDEVLKNIGGVV